MLLRISEKQELHDGRLSAVYRKTTSYVEIKNANFVVCDWSRTTTRKQLSFHLKTLFILLMEITLFTMTSNNLTLGDLLMF